MFKRFIAVLVCATFILSNFQYVHAQDFSINQLPVPGTMLGVSTPYVPLTLKGLVVNPKKPLEFQFIVDTGKGPRDSAFVKEQANQLIKYFLAGLTIPEGDLWVNLSPYEKDRMVPTALGQTDLGRDLLAQDYILKQLTASLIYPEKDLGKEFWSRVYKQAQEKFGTTKIPVNTFNKVWILPDQAQVFENGNAAYVTQSTLKVMLDEDYLAKQKHTILRNDMISVGSNIVRQIVIPEITKEVNTGKNFAPLRQIYEALILAKWYKETVQNGLLDAVYKNKNQVKGINLFDPSVKQEIYNRYLQAYKKGVFNYIKEDATSDGQVTPRKYFSGGVLPMEMKLKHNGTMSAITSDGAMISLTVGLVVAGAIIAGGLFIKSRIQKANQKKVEDARKLAEQAHKLRLERLRQSDSETYDKLELELTRVDRISYLEELFPEAVRIKNEGYGFKVIYQPATYREEKTGRSVQNPYVYDMYVEMDETKEVIDQQEVLKIERGNPLTNIALLGPTPKQINDSAMFAKTRIAGWKLTGNVEKITGMLVHNDEDVRKAAIEAIAGVIAKPQNKFSIPDILKNLININDAQHLIDMLNDANLKQFSDYLIGSIKIKVDAISIALIAQLYRRGYTVSAEKTLSAWRNERSHTPVTIEETSHRWINPDDHDNSRSNGQYVEVTDTVTNPKYLSISSNINLLERQMKGDKAMIGSRFISHHLSDSELALLREQDEITTKDVYDTKVANLRHSSDFLTEGEKNIIKLVEEQHMLAGPGTDDDKYETESLHVTLRAQYKAVLKKIDDEAKSGGFISKRVRNDERIKKQIIQLESALGRLNSQERITQVMAFLNAKASNFKGEEVHILSDVTQNGMVIGRIDRKIAEKFGYIHETANVVLLDPEGNVVLQLRNKDNYDDHLSAYGGHLGVGESHLKAAKEEGQQETGLKEGFKNPIMFIGYEGYDKVGDSNRERRSWFVQKLTKEEWGKMKSYKIEDEKLVGANKSTDDRLTYKQKLAGLWKEGKGEVAAVKSFSYYDIENARQKINPASKLVDKNNRFLPVTESYKGQSITTDAFFTPDAWDQFVKNPILWDRVKTIIKVDFHHALAGSGTDDWQLKGGQLELSDKYKAIEELKINTSDSAMVVLNWILLRYSDQKLESKLIEPDRAMLQVSKVNPADNGGVDLNQININRMGKTVIVQFDPAQLNELMQGGFEGFSFTIESMTQIPSPFPLLGIHVPRKEEELLAKV
ncbi:MAG: NUDIX hydrolase [Candidatus Omnitrophica bacterium]|nr:NUDIX hydrolase [Candidatus Omnitrophota bacterium]